MADQLAGGRTLAQTTRSFGLDPLTVKNLAETLAGIDSEAVKRIQVGFPRLLTVLAASHAAEALERDHSDPATAATSTFGAKLAAVAPAAPLTPIVVVTPAPRPAIPGTVVVERPPGGSMDPGETSTRALPGASP